MQTGTGIPAGTKLYIAAGQGKPTGNVIGTGRIAIDVGDETIDSAEAYIGAGDAKKIRDRNAVWTDKAQSFTDSEKQQARNNIGAGIPITVDSTLSLTSENPVTNKATAEGLRDKIDCFQGNGEKGKVMKVNNEGYLLPTELENADWNENDETSPAYVKNRTHYVKRTILDATMQNYESIHGYNLDSITFMINGTMYYDVPTENVGNFTYEYNAGDYTISANMRTYAFTITPEAEFKIVQEEYTALSKKYLPDENFNIINAIPKSEENPFTGGAIKTIGCKTEYQPGANSFAQGANCQASGPNSTANGVECITTSTANWSHAEGRQTIAASQYQHVFGSCNIKDESGLLEIAGNGGGESERSNAYTLDRSGNAWYAGDVYVGSTSGTNKDTGSVKLAREDKVVSLEEQTLTDTQKATVRQNIGAGIELTWSEF